MKTNDCYIELLVLHITSLNKSQAWHIDGTTNNPYNFYKVLTFKWQVSKFEPNWIISLQLSVIEFRLLLANFQNNGKIWISSVDKALLSDRKNTVQAKQWLNNCYLDSAPLETMVKRWYADFIRGHIGTNDAERSGHPNSAVVLENTEKLHELILANCKLKFCEIEELKISQNSVLTILHEHLSMRKLCSKWVQRLLTVDQKQCVDNSECCLQTWIHHSLKSNWQSAEWTAAGESCPKQSKTQTSAGKVLASIFWDAQVFCLSITLRKEEPSIANIILHYWCVWRKKSPKNGLKWRKNMLLHQDNAPCHKLMAKLHELHFKLLLQPWLLAVCRPQKNAPGKDLAPMKQWYLK